MSFFSGQYLLHSSDTTVVLPALAFKRLRLADKAGPRTGVVVTSVDDELRCGGGLNVGLL